ncbi:MAG: NAD(P)-binding domain-containing protein, partial [Pyrinomonadaceae bacterium]
MKAHFGMIGLGTMGRNFLLNVAEHGISGVGYDLDPEKRALLLQDGAGMPLDVGSDLPDFLAKLESPRNIMLLVPAGPIVDKVIAELIPLLDADDLIIDAGNSHFTDTDRRMAELEAQSIGYLGVGVSGGESGARHGASIMVGGRREYYDRIEPTFKVAAVEFNGPCVGYMGTGSAGHFVKMVHNGIEYALMQMIAETYDYMRRVL